MPNLDKLNKEKIFFKITLVISYLFFATLIIASVIVLHLHYLETTSKKLFFEESSIIAKTKTKYFQDFYLDQQNSIKAVADNSDFLKFVIYRDNISVVENLFKTMMKSNRNYMQMRFINPEGYEVLRYDREHIGGDIYKIKSLQDKSNRYYYKACCQLQEGDFWFSSIDLNMEHGKIEKPIAPVIRVAYPIYLDKHFRGFLIINIFMNEVLNFLTKSAMYEVHMVDNNGEFLIHNNPKYSWSKCLKSNYKLKNEFKNDKEVLRASLPSLFDDSVVYPITLNNIKKFSFIFKIKNEKIATRDANFKKRVIITILLVIIIAIPLVFLVSSPIKKMYNSLQKKSDELTDLANNLEAKIQEEIAKNAKKDQILANQSKLAALGEMIGNIAHQWRHPITRLSLILQNIKTYEKNPEMRDRSLKNALTQIDYMSETIDDFKNFYKPDMKKEQFCIQKAIGSAIKILWGMIKHRGIEINIEKSDDLFIIGYPNQFSQVILNLLHNARDAIEENQTKNPKINIKIVAKNSKIEVQISDNGGGVKEEIIDKIFDAHFTTKAEKGSGIGLYMSKLMIEEQFGGKIYIYNSDIGAVFVIKL